MTYKEFIDNILETRGRFACGDEYHERHHIIPRCMGGGNDEENLIDLFAREHYEAHKLLALENRDNDSLVYAWWMMAHINSGKRTTYEVPAEEYDEARRRHAENTSKRMSGRIVSDETKKLLSKNHADVNGVNNGFYGKQHTASTKLILSKNAKNRFQDKHNHPFYGKRLTEEHKVKVSKNHADFSYDKHPEAKIVCQFDVNMTLINVYGCCSLACKTLQVNPSSMTMCCQGKQKNAGGFIWKYLYDQTYKDGVIIPGAISLGLITEKAAFKFLNNKDAMTNVDEHMKYKIQYTKRCKPIYCVQQKTIYISIRDAARKTGVDINGIGLVLRNKQKTSGGCNWYYLYDDVLKNGSIIPGAISLGLLSEDEALEQLKRMEETGSDE